VQVGHPVALDDVGVLEQERGFGVVAEEPDSGAEHHGYQVDADLIDESGGEGLPGDVARRDRRIAALAAACAWARALSRPSVTNVNGASR
jgi:hypothetical protein